jgi:hypothetical protein
MNNNQKDLEKVEPKIYETLDKDYGRTKFVGPGYGELDQEQYKMLEDLIQ